MKALLLLVLLAGGCTASQHRWYRGIVTAGGAAAQIEDTRMSQWAIARGTPETNPMFTQLFGDYPGPREVAIGGALGVTAMVGWWRLVEVLPDRGDPQQTEWVKDVLATLPMFIEGYCVWRNTASTGGLR